MPGATAADPVMVSARSAITGATTTVVFVLLWLLFVFGSVTVAGGDTVAVFVNVVAIAGATPVMVIVTDPPLGKFSTVPVTLLPLTLGAAHVASPVGEPQLAATPVIPTGTASA